MLRAARPLALVVVAGLAAVSACGSAAPRSVSGLPDAAGLPRSALSHLVMMVMENEEAKDVLGAREAPFINGLARRYAQASAYYAITHPSLPNYLALTGGSTFGIQSDCTDCAVSGPNLARQLSDTGVSWKAYMEDLPRRCDTTAGSGGYAKKHDPFLYYRDVAAQPRLCRHVAPYGELAGDLRAGRLPTFAWVTPNLCHDGHDCPLGTADRFLAATVPSLLRELGPRGVLFVVWDEGSSDQGCCSGQAHGGRVVLVAAGPGARPGAVLRTRADHYSLLRAVEDLLALPRVGQAADVATPSLGGLLRSTRPLR